MTRKSGKSHAWRRVDTRVTTIATKALLQWNNRSGHRPAIHQLGDRILSEPIRTYPEGKQHQTEQRRDTYTGGLASLAFNRVLCGGLVMFVSSMLTVDLSFMTIAIELVIGLDTSHCSLRDHPNSLVLPFATI